MKILKNKN